MLWTICAVMLVLWALGLVSGQTIVSLAYVGLAAIVVMLLASVIRGRQYS